MIDQNHPAYVPKKDRLRMAHWLLMAIVFFTLAAIVALSGIHEIRTVGAVSQALGKVTISAFVGYWIDRSAFRDRVDSDSEPLKQLRRAIIIGCAMLSVAGAI